MKVVVDDNYYIQTCDIKFLKTIGITIPFFIEPIIKKASYDDFNFIKIKDQNAIDFFDSLDWVINYDDIKNYTFEELLNLSNAIINEKYAIEDEKTYLPSNFDSLNQKIRFLNHKLTCIKDLLLKMDGKLNYKIPKQNILKRMLTPKEKVS